MAGMIERKTVLALVSDLMFATTISATLERANYQVEMAESQQEALTRVRQLGPHLLLVDLACQGLALSDLVVAAKDQGVPVVAFGPHVEQEGLRAALKAGCIAALPRSRFARDMPRLVAMYARGAPTTA